MVSSYIAGVSFFPKRSRSILWSKYKPEVFEEEHGVGLVARSGTTQRFRIGKENTQNI